MTTTESTDTTIISLSGAEGIVTAAAHLLGFQPSESLVIACMTRARGRVGPVIRVDLDALTDPGTLAGLAETAARYADHVAVVIYHDAPRLPPMTEIVRALGRTGVPISAHLSVSQGLIRDADSPAAFARDPGVPVPAAGDHQFDTLAAASALVGRRLLPDRAALAASITPAAGSEARLAARVDKELRSLPFRELARDAMLTVDESLRVDRVLDRAVADYRERGTVTPGPAARLIALMQVIPCRDRVLARAVREEASDHVAVLASLAASCPDRYAPEVCSVLAAVAYRFGNGALANCALDRALAQRPKHRLSSLLRATIASHLPPSTLAGLGDREGTVTRAATRQPPPADRPPSSPAPEPPASTADAQRSTPADTTSRAAEADPTGAGEPTDGPGR